MDRTISLLEATYPLARYVNKLKILFPFDGRNWLTEIKWRKINRTKRRNALTNGGRHWRAKMSARQSEQRSQRYERLYRELRYRFFHSCLSVSRLIATLPPPAISSMALNVLPTYNSHPFLLTNHLVSSHLDDFGEKIILFSIVFAFFFFFSISLHRTVESSDTPFFSLIRS